MDQNFVCTVAISPDLYPSRHVKVINVSPDSPVPQDLAYALRPLPPSVTVIDPFLIDAGAIAREARDAELFRIESSKPRHSYETPELCARLGLTEGEFSEVVHQLGFPQPRLCHETHGLMNHIRSFHRFDGPDVDRWIERVERLFGARGKRKAAK